MSVAPSRPVPPPTPFDAASRSRPSLLQRFLRHADEDAATRAVAGLFADADPGDVPAGRVADALAAQGVRPDAAGGVAERVFAHAVATFLDDDRLTDHETAYLDRLRAPLGLDAARGRRLLLAAARPRVEAAARAACADGRLTPGEIDTLQRLARGLGVPDEELAAVCAEVVGPVLRAAVEAAVGDRRYSPAEEERLRERAGALGVPRLTFDAATEDALRHFRRLWQIEHGTLPVEPVAIALAPGEVCHHSAPCRWLEPRPRTAPAADAGLTTSVYVARGARFRTAAAAPRRVPRRESQAIDVGTVHVTSARVLFDGAAVQRSVPHAALLGIQVFAESIRLERAGGRSPDLVLGGSRAVETVAVLLAELMR